MTPRPAFEGAATASLGDPRAQGAWQAPLAVAVVLLVIGVLFLPTVASMVQIWRGSGTFTHGFIVLPASLWFIWHRRYALATVPVVTCPAGFAVVATAGAVWLAGVLSASLSLQHVGLVALAVAAVVTLFGLRFARAIAFPLAFLFFAVPFGEAFVPQLMDWTADFTVAALRATGVPVLREGNDLTIPTGRWAVVEACSGARYLIASLVAGTLYAWVMFRSPRRRALFLVASLLVPIVANWLRAYLIVMLGHLSNNRIATGVDHFIYGWVFFGFVVFMLFALGARWREDAPPAAALTAAARVPLRLAPSGLLAVAAMLLVWPVLGHLLLNAADERPVQPAAIAAAGHWQPANVDLAGWQPSLAAPRATIVEGFAAGADQVAVRIGVFRDQSQESELVSAQHRPAPEGWRVVADRPRALELPDGRRLGLRDMVLRTPGERHLRVWRWYWLGGPTSASDAVAKADLALDRLLLRSDTAAWVAVATAHDPEQPRLSDQALQGFAAVMLPSIERALASTAER